MTVDENSTSQFSIKMAKRQKTVEAVDDISVMNEPLPSEPSDVAKALSLNVNRRPDINEYRCEIDEDIDDFPTLHPPLSDSELSELPPQKTKKNKKKKSKHEKTGASTSGDDDKTDDINTDKGATSETHSQSSPSKESAMDAT